MGEDPLKTQLSGKSYILNPWGGGPGGGQVNPFTDHATHLGASSRTDLRTSLIILVNAFSAAHVPMYKVEIRAQDEGETRRKFTFIHFLPNFGVLGYRLDTCR